MDKKKEKLNIGITIGDLNGIGPEVIIKALSAQKILDFFNPVIYGSGKVISFYRKMMDNSEFNFAQVKDDNLIPRRVNVINCWNEHVEITPGKGTEDGGKYALMALKKACDDLQANKIHALVTGPINKEMMPKDDFNSAGHTEFLSNYFNASDSLMFLVSEQTRVGLVTGHIPLKDVPLKITKSGLESKLKLMEQSLTNDFGVQKPKIAVLGLNPHAGENGLLGVEESNIISPVIKDFKEHGKLIFGPFPADGFFGSGQYAQYDGVLAMYHDQGLVGFKSIAFSSGVNFTAGLGVIRTSPDHGTAYSIAGKNKADEGSMRRAMMLAYDIASKRRQTVEI